MSRKCNLIFFHGGILPGSIHAHRGRTYGMVSPLDTVRKDDAGRNSIYQRLVNRLVHVPGDGQGCSGRRGEGNAGKGEKERGRNGHRGRDVDDHKTKIRNSNLSREQLISRTSPSSLVSAATSSAALGWWTIPPPSLYPEVAAQTALSSSSATPHTDAARLTFLRPEIPTVIGRQSVRLTVATEWRN